ncbi:transcription factor bHLH110 [Aristolochia californica]|uniref:transcription factor bHLH110 n=1 Tax=Aristolochia californica TaxID=171875 RepID=UPI0035D88A9A
MESANLSHQHQHQEQFSGSSSIALPSLHGADNSHLWNQNLIQNGSNYSSNVNGLFLTSRDLRQSHDSVAPPSVNISMFQDLGSYWASSADSCNNHSTHELHLSKVKAELPESFPKYSNSSNLEEIPLPSTSYIKHEQQYLQDLNEKFLLRSFSSSGFQTSTELMYPSSKSYTSLGTVTPSTRGSFSRIHPSATISGPNPSSSPFLGSLGLNMQAMDLLASAKLGGSFIQPSISNLALLRETVPSGFENIRELNQESSNCSSQKISFVHGAADAKRPNGFSDSKVSQSASKKPRFESRSSFPPFKVRKEKLGDRIAALQQLVAPFGKTDTASVLMEAIGYIKFLQEQVETLSVPYMKSSGKTKRGSLQGGASNENGEEEPKRDLRSRGLCLVPLSCTSYVTNDTGSVWSPPNFNGGN